MKTKTVKIDRNEVNRQRVNTRTEKEEKEIQYGVQLRLANKKNEYIRNLINGRYFLARCNTIAEQLLPGGKIEEKLDGRFKTPEYMKAEYALFKLQAINSMRTAHFSKKELLEEFKLTEKDIAALEKDYYDGKIIREEYDEGFKRGHKAEFVNTPEN